MHAWNSRKGHHDSGYSICNPHVSTMRGGQRQENLYTSVCQLAWQTQVVTRKRHRLKQDEGKDWPEDVLTSTYMQCHTRTPALTHEHAYTQVYRQFVDWELKFQYYSNPLIYYHFNKWAGGMVHTYTPSTEKLRQK